MFVIGNLVLSIAQLLNMLFTLISWLIIIRAIISWVNPDPFNPIVQFLYKTTEPILMPIKRFFHMQFWAIDISPLIAIFILIFMQNFIVRTLMDFGASLR